MSGFLLWVKGLGSFSEKLGYYMWGKISKVPLPDFEPPRGNPERNPLKDISPQWKPFRESLKRKPSRGISPKGKSLSGYFTTGILYPKDPHKAHYTRTPHKALLNRMVRNRSVSDLSETLQDEIPQREILIEPYFDGTPLKGAIRNLSCFARGGRFIGTFKHTHQGD